jgi:hypothetical protein
MIKLRSNLLREYYEIAPVAIATVGAIDQPDN